MKLNKKFLSLISLCFLSINLTSSKPVNTHFLEDVKWITYYASPGVAVGAVAETISVVPTTAAITAYNSVKEKPINKQKFKNILKRAANKSFKIIKWLSIIPAALYTAGLMAPPKPNTCECYKLGYVVGLSASLTVGALSWIGQKLTEDGKNIPNKNKKS